MKDRGIWLNETNVTFQNIEVVEENVITNAEADGSGNTANLVNNSDFILKNASLTLNGPGNKTGGSGMYLYKKSNLYVDDGRRSLFRDSTQISKVVFLLMNLIMKICRIGISVLPVVRLSLLRTVTGTA